MKKSFILYNDMLSVFKKLDDKQKVELLDAIIDFNVTGETKELSLIVDVAFEPFKNQFIRDREKYDSIVERNRENGKLGGRPRSKKPKKPSGLSGNPKNPSKPRETQKTQANPKNLDNDTDNVNDTDNETEKVSDKLKASISSFKDFRKKIRKPLTAHAEDLIVKELEKLAPGNDDEKVKIINQSIMFGYQGVFPLKENNKSKKSIEEENAEYIKEIDAMLQGDGELPF